MVSTVVIIPTYNEKESIERLVRQIDSLSIDKVVLVVDDNSPDGTGEIVDSLTKELSSLQIIHNTGKMGLGTAYCSGFQRGMELGMERFITMDADFSHDPKYIPELIKKTETFDIAIGSRYVLGGGTVAFGLHRQLISRVANLLAHKVLKLEPADCTSGFRCYHRQVLETINPASIVSDGYSFLVEMLFKCTQANFSVGEIPIIFVNRAEGKSKISKKEILKAMKTVWQLSRNK